MSSREEDVLWVWTYRTTFPMNLFVNSAFGTPVRSEDLEKFSPDRFLQSIAKGLDDADAQFPGIISIQTNAEIGRSLDYLNAYSERLNDSFALARRSAPTRAGDVFITVRHLIDIATAFDTSITEGTISSILSVLERGHESTQRLRQTREAAALYAADLFDAIEVWLLQVESNVLRSLDADFRKHGLR